MMDAPPSPHKNANKQTHILCVKIDVLPARLGLVKQSHPESEPFRALLSVKKTPSKNHQARKRKSNMRSLVAIFFLNYVCRTIVLPVIASIIASNFQTYFLYVLFSVRKSIFVIYEVCKLSDPTGMRLINRQRCRQSWLVRVTHLTLNVNYTARTRNIWRICPIMVYKIKVKFLTKKKKKKNQHKKLYLFCLIFPPKKSECWLVCKVGFFLKKNFVDTCPFMWPLIPRFSSDVPSGFESQSGQPSFTLGRGACTCTFFKKLALWSLFPISWIVLKFPCREMVLAVDLINIVSFILPICKEPLKYLKID